MTKILCNFSKYSEGKKENGLSLSYFLFFETFVNLGHEVELFENNSKVVGKNKMNKDFIDKVDKFKPDIIFSMNISDDFEKNILLKIKNRNDIKSVCWMSDDQWRFNTLGKSSIGYFDYIITTDPLSVPKYESDGQKAILSQYGVKKKDLLEPSKKYIYDVSFVGGLNSWRKFIIEELEKEGIKVECFGKGWKNGRVSFDEMYNVFNKSKINLNLSNSVHYNFKYIISGVVNFKKQEKLIDILRPLANIILSKKRAEQIKARFFEVVGAGGFLLSYDLNGIEDYFIPSHEIAIYNGSCIKDIAKQIKYYLKNDNERYNISTKGFEKVKKQFTSEKILNDIIRKINDK